MTASEAQSHSARRGIALIGLRGSGKSTVGRLLAQRLGLPFVDTDEVITARAGKSIADIFHEDGEPVFRALEKEVIADVTAGEPRVISAGGGAILNSENVSRLRSVAVIIWLTASPDILWSRIARDGHTRANRPALTPSFGKQELEELLRERDAHYRAAAEVIVDTERLMPSEVTEMILDRLTGL